MKKMQVIIDGYDFCFNRELLSRYAYVMGEPIADIESLRYEILTFADTVSAAVGKYGAEQLVKMVEERLYIQVMYA